MNIRARIQNLPYGGKKALQLKAGMSKGTVYLYQHGRGRNIHTAIMLAKALGYPDQWPEFFDGAVAAKKSKP